MQRTISLAGIHGGNDVQGFSDMQGGGVYMEFQWEMVPIDNPNSPKHGEQVRRLKLIKRFVRDSGTASASYLTPEQAKRRYPEEWAHFIKTGEDVVHGTPIRDIPGISASQEQMIRLSGLRTVEDLLGVEVDQLSHIGREVVEVYHTAKAWQERKVEAKNDIDYGREKARQDARIESLERQLAAMEARATTAERERDAYKQVQGISTEPPKPEPVGGGTFEFDSNPLAEGPAYEYDELLAQAS